MDTLCKRKFEGGLGLKNMYLFNQTLLAKQWWKIATKPNSMLHKLFKALYFFDISFLQASLGKNSSYYWRSLMWGQQLLKMGMRWKLGTGNQISIRLDNWIPGFTHFKPYSLANLDLAIAHVSQLINQ